MTNVQKTRIRNDRNDIQTDNATYWHHTFEQAVPQSASWHDYDVNVARVSTASHSVAAEWALDAELITEDQYEDGHEIFVWRYEDPQFVEFYATKEEALQRFNEELDELHDLPAKTEKKTFADYYNDKPRHGERAVYIKKDNDVLKLARGIVGSSVSLADMKKMYGENAQYYSDKELSHQAECSVWFTADNGNKGIVPYGMVYRERYEEVVIEKLKEK